jgi:hypothetical protein
MAKVIEISKVLAPALEEYAKRAEVGEWAIVQCALQHYLEDMGGYKISLENGGKWTVERKCDDESAG